MKFKVEEWEPKACRVRSKVPILVAKHRGIETCGSEMSVIQVHLETAPPVDITSPSPVDLTKSLAYFNRLI